MAPASPLPSLRVKPSTRDRVWLTFATTDRERSLTVTWLPATAVSLVVTETTGRLFPWLDAQTLHVPAGTASNLNLPLWALVGIVARVRPTGSRSTVTFSGRSAPLELRRSPLTLTAGAPVLGSTLWLVVASSSEIRGGSPCTSS